MNDHEGSSSWLLRSHFSRAVCYRPGTCSPSVSWIQLSPKEIASLLEARTKSEDRRSGTAALADKQQCQVQQGDHHQNAEATTVDLDFSFPSPFSPSRMSSDCSRHSKSSFDYSSPSRDEDACPDSERPSSPAQNGFLRSVFSSFSVSSSRWSTSSDSFNERQEEEHSPRNLFKGGSWLGWISPKASPTSSPMVSPAGSPKGGSPGGSPRGSFGYSTCGRVFSITDDAESCSMSRVPSWSHHLSNAGNERAVLPAVEWMFDLSQLLLGERFATGNHSRIYHGVYKDGPVAVKVIRQPDEDCLLADRLEQIFANEVTTLSGLNHRNIIKFVAACRKPPVLCIITEYLSGGSLRSFLHKREGQRLTIDEVLRMALNIAAGMEYLHMKGIMHRDLKSENLVLGEDGLVKILDFGVSCFESQCDYKADEPGTYRWMAPEMLCHKPYTRKVDVYSFGIVLWELLTARVPYEEMGAVQAAFCVLHKNLRPPIPLDCPPALEDLMCACWSADPTERPEFWEILRELASLRAPQSRIPAVS